MLGPTKFPAWLRIAYIKAVDFMCEDCREIFKENELEIHRIVQGYKNGKYRPGNIKVLCHECHLKYAENW